jgi:hypothetical protein
MLGRAAEVDSSRRRPTAAKRTAKGDTMQQRLQTRAFERVTQMLQPGEEPIVAARAQVGQFSSGRFGAVVKGGLALQGGMAAAVLANRQQFVVLTDRRLIFLAQTIFGGPGRKVLGEVPREHVALAEATIGVVSLVRIAFGAQGDGVALTFPRVDQKNAKALAAALGHTPPQRPA